MVLSKTLYSVNAKGKVTVWTIKVYPKNSSGKIYVRETVWGAQGGKMQTAKVLVHPLKSRTARQRAIQQLETMVKKRERKGAHSKCSRVRKVRAKTILPILAKKWEDGKNDATGKFVQPKLDGMRAFLKCDADANGHITSTLFCTRNGKPITSMVHIQHEIQTHMRLKHGVRTVYLDGELYNHDIQFEEIISASRKQKPTEEAKRIYFCCFDMYIPSAPSMNFVDRFCTLSKLFGNHGKSVKEVAAHNASNSMPPRIDASVLMDHVALTVTTQLDSSIVRTLKNMENDGYEGIILRDPKSVYKPGRRGGGLWKLKSFMDSEYEIVGAVDGKGRDKGAVIWVCKCGERTFNVPPNWNISKRKKVYTEYKQNPDKYNGKMLTVMYQEMTKNGVPRFPRGIEFRDYE